MTRATTQPAAVSDALGATSPLGSDPNNGATVDRRLSDSNQLWLNRVVDGRYRVLEVIGRGGMGVVYRVEHMRMGKIAAMKVLHRDLATDSEVVQRFEREAAAISKLHHPHTVQVFDFGAAEDALYLIMEYVRGQDLARVLERDGALPWSRVAPLLVQICGALQEAHELGIVHRDLKPENVLITRTTAGRDYAKVLDFGLAKLDQRGVATTETDRQQIVGTPYFMAPEQIRGDDVDARTDLYAFGALMFELLTGTHLYTGSSAVGVLTKHLTAEPDAPSMRAPKMGIPPAVDHLCRKALARNPDDRWQSASELAAAIEEVYAETVAETTGTSHGRHSAASRPLTRTGFVLDEGVADSAIRLRRADIDAFERGIVRQRWFVAGGGVAIIVGLAAAGVYVAMREPPPRTEEQEPNDDASHADRIALATPVTGYIGKRRSATEADRDVFRVPPGKSDRRVVTATVTAIQNVDLNLDLADGDNLHGATADEGGMGEPEVLHRRSSDGALLVTVGETIPKGQTYPVENVSDPYTLTVTEDDPGAGEIEPNNTDADATPLALAHPLLGYLDSRRDVDILRWTGVDGRYTVEVRADGLPLQWRGPDGKVRTPGVVQVELHKGDEVRFERSDANGTGTLVGRDAPWTIKVTK
jgi:serine/threonine-protein kinase